MARPASKYPTELELEILKIVWRNGPLPVRQVREALTEVRKLAYTSVMTVMNIMVGKGYLKRRKNGNSYVYYSSVRRRATIGRMLKDLVDRAFEGSAAAVMVSLLGTAKLKETEIHELRKLLNTK